MTDALTVPNNNIPVVGHSDTGFPGLHADSGVLRIDLRFLAGGLKMRLNQALSVLSLSLCFL